CAREGTVDTVLYSWFDVW
nr:immunoglobulin heavy chain junction region [Macaca mulatta]MPN71890.1 immunoglobulin heavy chain junction region [Macaca mulatta]MPN72046.1 immunoglobulin heavy chain junction region [Macaca mulatta]MPN73535.1 immunoglobulin heavy chain junction region [Macaca mulatta]MPN74516.1 immunoglobulin heavy chain junction region [Macaca mulatta]